MLLDLKQVSNFEPTLARDFSKNEFNRQIDTHRLSPSDIPREIEITMNNGIVKCVFDYTVNESKINFSSLSINENSNIFYSRITGRVYSVIIDNISLIQLIKSKLSDLRNVFTKDRQKNNILIGSDLTIAILHIVSDKVK